jgi:N-acetylglucosamine malate deacetylase 1
MTATLDLLAIFAHPDDAELLCGGALAASVDAGEAVGILDLTRGEMGTRGTPELRAEEAAAAARVLGVEIRRNAELPDGKLENSLSQRRTVARHIRELRPRTVVTHWLEGRHPDHREAAALATDAAFLAGLARADLPLDPFRPRKVIYTLTFREQAPPPTFVVDVSRQMERRLEAMACFASQWDGARGAGEAFPGGDRPLEDQVRAQLAHYGSLIRVAYGEPFWTREAVRAATLGTVDVPSF